MLPRVTRRWRNLPRVQRVNGHSPSPFASSDVRSYEPRGHKRAPDESVAARLLKCTVPTKTQSYRTKVELCVINVGLTMHFSDKKSFASQSQKPHEFSERPACADKPM